MNIIDIKIAFGFFCNNDILQYLDTKDKMEFSSSCKFIYQKCTRFRLANYEFDFNNSIELTGSINTGNKLANNIDSLQLAYLNSIIIKFRANLSSLECIRNDNYYTLEYLSLCFNNLNSLSLGYLFIPKETFKLVIENLHNLGSLVLFGVRIVSRNNEQDNIKIRFSNYLKRLSLHVNLVVTYDYNDPIDLKRNGLLARNSNINALDILDIAENGINNIKYLSWFTIIENTNFTLNKLLYNNPNLSTLEVKLDYLNFETLSIISNNRNLTKLIIDPSNFRSLRNLDFPMLPFIKTIVLKNVIQYGIESINLLIKNCPNLEKLTYLSISVFGNHLQYIITCAKNLRTLRISHINLDILLCTAFPDSNIEHLELVSPRYSNINLKCFINLKQLKSVKVSTISNSINICDYTGILYDGVNYWKIINYSGSVLYWKIFSL